MMIWSKTGIPKSSPAALSRVVMLKSSSDGIGSPDGWLCASMIDAALVRMAGLKTSLGCTKDNVRVPIQEEKGSDLFLLFHVTCRVNPPILDVLNLEILI